MLFEPGLGILPRWRDHLALDEPKACADLAHLNPGSGYRFGGICRHLFYTINSLREHQGIWFAQKAIDHWHPIQTGAPPTHLEQSAAVRQFGL
jgi:hypothetical protein